MTDPEDLDAIATESDRWLVNRLAELSDRASKPPTWQDEAEAIEDAIEGANDGRATMEASEKSCPQCGRGPMELRRRGARPVLEILECTACGWPTQAYC